MIHLGFTFSELVSTFLDKLKESNDLDDFFTSNYGKSPSFALGHDERDEYGEEEAPFVVLVPLNWTGGITSGNTMFTMDIDIGIEDAVFSDHNLDNVQDMRGFHRLDEAINVVMSILEEHAHTYNAIADDISVTYNDSEFFPLHVANMSVVVRMDNTMNGTQTLGR